MKRYGQPFGTEISYKLYWNEKEKKLAGGIYFNNKCEGPPGNVHGGCIATAFDVAFGWFSVKTKGFGCVTLNLSVNYRKFIPLNSVVRIEIWCEKCGTGDDQKLLMKGKMTNPFQLDAIDNPKYDPELLNCDASALFYQTYKKALSFEQTYKLYGGRKGLLMKEKVLEQLMQQSQRAKSNTAPENDEQEGKAVFNSQAHLSKL